MAGRLRQRDRITWILTILAVVTAIFAIGGALRGPVVVLAMFSAAALGFQVTSMRRLTGRPPLLVLLATATGLTALQLIPVPATIVRALHPTGYELVVDGAILAGQGGPSFLPLSLDPPGTLFELVKLLSYLALAYGALRMASSERGRVRIMSLVGGAIGGAAAVALIHKLLDAKTVYGIYRPQYAFAEFLGPLLNRNHFASLLGVGVLVAGGLALRPRLPTAHRLAWGAVGALCLVESLLIQSRGAAVGLAVGLGIFGGLLLLQRWFQESANRMRRPEIVKVTAPITIVVLCALTMVVYLSAGGVGEQLGDTTTAELSEPRSKFVAWQSSAQLLRDSPWIGVGRGAFESSFTRVHPASGLLTFSHLENEYLQAAVDWGIPGALLLALGVAWTALIAVRRWNGGPLAAAGLAAMVAVGAHSVVDFGIELPGLAVPLILILSTLTFVPLAERRQTDRRLPVARVTGVVALALTAVVLATPWGRTLNEDHNRLRSSEEKTVDDRFAAMGRHPLDYLAPALAASALYDAGDVRAKDLLNHALRLHPSHPDLHRLAARILLRNGKPGQALVEYGLAIGSTLNPVDLLLELVKRFPDPSQAASAIPTDHLQPRRIARILNDEGKGDVALLYLKRVIENQPQDLLDLKLMAQIAIERKDYAASEMAARRLANLERTQDSYLSLARVLHQVRNYGDAEKAVLQALGKKGPTAVLIEANLLLGDIYIDAKNWARAKEHLNKMREQPELYILARREIHRRLAVVEDALGNTRQAEWERQRVRAP